MIVRDQSNNYFHLTPKIGPLWGAPYKKMGAKKNKKNSVQGVGGWRWGGGIGGAPYKKNGGNFFFFFFFTLCKG